MKAKRKAYPEGIVIDDSECKVSLQNLLKHTVERLVTHLNVNIEEDTNTRLVLLVKYGFDGTNSNKYKQKSNEKNVLDYMFCSSIVPLMLIDKSTDKVYWVNSRPSSTRFCRPLKIFYQKETDDLCKSEEADLAHQIQNLKDIEFPGFKVGFEMMLTMIDGKVTCGNLLLYTHPYLLFYKVINLFEF